VKKIADQVSEAKGAFAVSEGQRLQARKEFEEMGGNKGLGDSVSSPTRSIAS